MAQKLVDEAVNRFHKILATEEFRDLAWAETLVSRMRTAGLANGTRLTSPFLRPHFLSKKQYEQLGKAASALLSAIVRLEETALANPALLQRMELLPAERMLAAIHPGYEFFHVTSYLNTALHNGTLAFQNFQASSANGLAQGELLADLFYDTAPVKELRKKYTLTKLPGVKYLLSSALKAWKAFGGKTKPNIAVLEFRQPFQSAESSENMILVELLRKAGEQVELVTPEQLEYRGSVLWKGDYRIDLIYRASSLQEFLLRFDLNHPLVRAYKERKVCLVNSFRSEIAQKRAVFSLLTDSQITGKFPLAEKKAIASFIPWTRVVNQTKTERDGAPIDLPEYILANRDTLVLAPNDSATALPTFDGASTDASAWERALKQALRDRYVVQDRVAPVLSTFPVLSYGSMEFKELQVDVHPHSFLGDIKSATTFLSAGNSGFSTVEGIAATFLIEGK